MSSKSWSQHNWKRRAGSSRFRATAAGTSSDSSSSTRRRIFNPLHLALINMADEDGSTEAAILACSSEIFSGVTPYIVTAEYANEMVLSASFGQFALRSPAICFVHSLSFCVRTKQDLMNVAIRACDVENIRLAFMYPESKKEQEEAEEEEEEGKKTGEENEEEKDIDKNKKEGEAGEKEDSNDNENNNNNNDGVTITSFDFLNVFQLLPRLRQVHLHVNPLKTEVIADIVPLASLFCPFLEDVRLFNDPSSSFVSGRAGAAVHHHHHHQDPNASHVYRPDKFLSNRDFVALAKNDCTLFKTLEVRPGTVFFGQQPPTPPTVSTGKKSAVGVAKLLLKKKQQEQKREQKGEEGHEKEDEEGDEKEDEEEESSKEEAELQDCLRVSENGVIVFLRKNVNIQSFQIDSGSDSDMFADRALDAMRFFSKKLSTFVIRGFRNKRNQKNNLLGFGGIFGAAFGGGGSQTAVTQEEKEKMLTPVSLSHFFQTAACLDTLTVIRLVNIEITFQEEAEEPSSGSVVQQQKQSAFGHSPYYSSPSFTPSSSSTSAAAGGEDSNNNTYNKNATLDDVLVSIGHNCRNLEVFEFQPACRSLYRSEVSLIKKSESITALANNSHLREFIFCGNQCNIKISDLIYTVKFWKKLELFSISEIAGINDELVDALAKTARHSLQRLSLASVGGVSTAAKLVMHLRHVTDASILTLARLCGKNLKSLRLALSAAHVTDYGMLFLSKFCRNLEALQLTESPHNISFDGLVPLLENNPRIRTLYLPANRSFSTRQVFEKLSSLLPLLERFRCSVSSPLCFSDEEEKEFLRSLFPNCWNSNGSGENASGNRIELTVEKSPEIGAAYAPSKVSPFDSIDKILLDLDNKNGEEQTQEGEDEIMDPDEEEKKKKEAAATGWSSCSSAWGAAESVVGKRQRFLKKKEEEKKQQEARRQQTGSLWGFSASSPSSSAAAAAEPSSATTSAETKTEEQDRTTKKLEAPVVAVKTGFAAFSSSPSSSSSSSSTTGFNSSNNENNQQQQQQTTTKTGSGVGFGVGRSVIYDRLCSYDDCYNALSMKNRFCSTQFDSIVGKTEQEVEEMKRQRLLYTHLTKQAFAQEIDVKNFYTHDSLAVPVYYAFGLEHRIDKEIAQLPALHSRVEAIQERKKKVREIQSQQELRFLQLKKRQSEIESRFWKATLRAEVLRLSGMAMSEKEKQQLKKLEANKKVLADGLEHLKKRIQVTDGYSHFRTSSSSTFSTSSHFDVDESPIPSFSSSEKRLAHEAENNLFLPLQAQFSNHAERLEDYLRRAKEVIKYNNNISNDAVCTAEAELASQSDKLKFASRLKLTEFRELAEKVRKDANDLLTIAGVEQWDLTVTKEGEEILKKKKKAEKQMRKYANIFKAMQAPGFTWGMPIPAVCTSDDDDEDEEKEKEEQQDEEGEQDEEEETKNEKK